MVNQDESVVEQQGLWAPLIGKKTEFVITEMEVIKEKAYSMILLSLSNEIIIEVLGIDIATGFWSKLESIYMTKSLTKKLLLIQRIRFEDA